MISRFYEEIELKKEELKIESFGLSHSTIEDVINLEQFKNIEMKNVNLVRLPNISFTKEEKGVLAEKAETRLREIFDSNRYFCGGF